MNLCTGCGSLTKYTYLFILNNSVDWIALSKQCKLTRILGVCAHWIDCALSSSHLPDLLHVNTGVLYSLQLYEYYRMVNFVRPGIFGHESETSFERDFIDPIMGGLTSDAPDWKILQSLTTSKKLHRFLEPYVQRKDVSELRKTLPALSQVVLHVRPTKMQTRLSRRYERHRKLNDETNFFKHYAALVSFNRFVSTPCSLKFY